MRTQSQFQDLASFENELARLIGRQTSLRPFVCEGSPLDCEIFLVGIEPATSMQAEFWQFWQFWRSGYGYDRQAWAEEYEKERRSQCKFAKSPTRRNMDHFIAGAAGKKVLETNVYAAPRARYQRDGSEIRAPFLFLLEAIRPKMLFVHGGPARKDIQALDLSIPIIEANHLSYQTGEAKARAYGAEAARLAGVEPEQPMS